MAIESDPAALLDLEAARAFANRWSGVTPYASEVVRYIESLIAEIERMRTIPEPMNEGVARLVTALKFYADRKTWIQPASVLGDATKADKDCGKIARAVLSDLTPHHHSTN